MRDFKFKVIDLSDDGNLILELNLKDHKFEITEFLGDKYIFSPFNNGVDNFVIGDEYFVSVLRKKSNIYTMGLHDFNF